MRLIKDEHEVVDEDLARRVDVDPARVWQLVDADPGDVGDLVDVGNRVANVDGALNALERRTLTELQERYEPAQDRRASTKEAAGAWIHRATH